jgi:hypothetical protein
MGTVKAEITLKHAGDVYLVKKGIIKEAEIRAITAEAIVDTGASTIVITEDVRSGWAWRLRSASPSTLPIGRGRPAASPNRYISAGKTAGPPAPRW